MAAFLARHCLSRSGEHFIILDALRARVLGVCRTACTGASPSSQQPVEGPAFSGRGAGSSSASSPSEWSCCQPTGDGLCGKRDARTRRGKVREARDNSWFWGRLTSKAPPNGLPTLHTHKSNQPRRHAHACMHARCPHIPKAARRGGTAYVQLPCLHMGSHRTSTTSRFDGCKLESVHEEFILRACRGRCRTHQCSSGMQCACNTHMRRMAACEMCMRAAHTYIQEAGDTQAQTTLHWWFSVMTFCVLAAALVPADADIQGLVPPTWPAPSTRPRRRELQRRLWRCMDAAGAQGASALPAAHLAEATAAAHWTAARTLRLGIR